MNKSICHRGKAGLVAAFVFGSAVPVALEAQQIQGPVSWNSCVRQVETNPVETAVPQTLQESPLQAPIVYPATDLTSGNSYPILDGSCGPMGFAPWSQSPPNDIVEAGTAHVTVTVPEKAKIFVNGDPTKSDGSVRYFVVRRLEQGKTYKFEFRAEMENAAGVKIEEKIELMLSSGSNESISLTPWKKVPEKDKEEKSEGGETK